MHVGGSFLAQGASAYPYGGYDFDARPGNRGNGSRGYNGAKGEDAEGYDGADGGPGGRGGLGGAGGWGGARGVGGDGAGGTIKLAGTTLTTAGFDAPRIDTRGGDSSTATQGRFILSQGTEGPVSFDVEGANVEYFDGPRLHNPYIHVPEGLPGRDRLDTAPMTGLTTGPDTFGIVAGLSAHHALFDDVRSGRPEGALAALMRVGNLPGAHPDLLGTDEILLLNLTDRLLSDAAVGATLAARDSPAFVSRLALGGHEHNPLFLAAAGPAFLSGLEPDQVFAFTVPDDFELRYWLAVGELSHGGLLSAPGQAIYLTRFDSPAPAVPEPGTLALLLAGVLGLLGMSVRREQPIEARLRPGPDARHYPPRTLC